MAITTDFSAIAERIGKTTSEKKAVKAMKEALGCIEHAIANGMKCSRDGHCFIDDAEQYASEGLDLLDKRTLDSIPEERINELVHEVALTFKYLEEYNEPATSPETNNKENTVTTAQTSAFIPSSATSMSFEDFVDGMYMFASKWTGEIAIDRVAVRAESLYNDIMFRTIVFEYRQAVLACDTLRKRMFRLTVTGDYIYTADNWDNSVIFSSKVDAYGEVIYDMLVRLPKDAEKERESLKKSCE